MTKETVSPITAVFGSNQGKEILSRWIEFQLSDDARSEGVSDNSVKNSSTEFFKLFQEAAKNGNLRNLDTPEWEAVLRMLSDLSASRALQGSSPSETARFVFSLKQALFEKLNEDFKQDDNALAKATWEFSTALDKLGMHTVEVFIRSREGIIRRQQQDILEMSTPVIKMWEGILAVPLIGTLDSARTQIVMENLLQAILDTGSKIAILDITGVPTVDTQTAQHLMKTVSATRLMGAECIISGIRPQIAQTIVHLGIDIADITTKATMEDALREAMARIGWRIEREVESKER
ncbi:MAG TPA: STAS domain-containing protein [Chroococcales cyanobacterium]